MTRELIPSVEKSFAYCYIRWNVTNFSFVGCADEFEIYSSDFAVRCPQVTKWRLGLKSLWTVEKTNMLSLLLERLESCAGPKTVRVSLRVAALDFRDEEDFCAEIERNFEKMSTYEIQLLSFPEISVLIADDQPNTLKIRCEMIVDHNQSGKKLLDPDVDICLEALSRDMRGLCNRSTLSDVILKIGDKAFRGHKSILSARNTVMRNFVGLNDAVEFNGIDAEALERVLRYLYTGNLYYLVVNPTIALFKCIQFFDMEEIEKCFARQQYFFVSNTISREYTLPWLICDFIGRNEDYYSSDLLAMENTDEVWKLHLYTRGLERNSSDMAIYAEYIMGSKPLDVCIEFSVLDRYNRQVLKKRQFGAIEVSGCIGCLSFMSRDYLADVLMNDVMIVNFTVRVSLGKQISTIISKKEQESPAAIPIGLFYSGLSLNMNQLYASGTDTDLILFAQGRHFPAHKCILAARSKMFSKILGKSHKTVIELDMKAEILSILLKYIYGGKLKRLGIHNLKQVYDSATVIGISSLKFHCSRYLKDLIATDTVTDVLVFADDNKDQELKSAAIDFIWRAQSLTDEEASWENLVYERPVLFKEIIRYFKLKELECICK